jgi:hypothetical protein
LSLVVANSLVTADVAGMADPQHEKPLDHLTYLSAAL